MRRDIYNYAFLLLVAFVLYGVVALLAPFAGALLSALTCAVAFYPMHRKIHKFFPKLRPTFQAAISDLLVLILFVTPLILLMWALFRESNSLIPTLKQGTDTVAQWREGNLIQTMPWMDHVRFFLSKAFGIKRAQFQASFIAGVDKGLQYMSVTGALIATHAIVFIGNLLLMQFALFFMFRDGIKGLAYLQTLLPMRREQSQELIDRIQVIITGLFRGLFLTSVVQGLAAMVGYLIVGAQGAVVLGALTAISGLIPVVGTFGIWVPASLYFFLQGSLLKGGFLLLWGLLIVVAFVDIGVRPYLVGKKAHLPTFILFFSFLGGIEIWGAKGMIWGPLIAAIAPMIFDMYRQRFGRQEALAGTSQSA